MKQFFIKAPKLPLLSIYIVENDLLRLYKIKPNDKFKAEFHTLYKKFLQQSSNKWVGIKFEI